MTKGILGIIICPMFDDNLVYSLSKDGEKKNVTVINNENNGSLISKLEKFGIEYNTIEWSDVLVRRYNPSRDEFNILILAINLGLHSKPKELKSKVEELTKDMAPSVDAFGFYLGMCGNYGWDIPAWSESILGKKGTMFCDSHGNLCDDCVGAAIGGGPRYLDLQKAYTGHFYLFPAMATNFDDFMNADQADSLATQESLTDEMREELGIDPDKDGYLRWLLKLGEYKNVLKIDTGIGDREKFDEKVNEVAKRMALGVVTAEDGWATLQPTDDIYNRCKALLPQ